MNLDILKECKNKNKNVGIITSYLSKQFLNREFNVFQLPSSNFIDYLKINCIETVIIDNIIYEKDHIWFNKEIGGLLSYLKLHKIPVFIIKNTNDKIKNYYMDYFILNFKINDDNSNDKYLYSSEIPLLVDEKKFNPINIAKKNDVLYIRNGEVKQLIGLQKFKTALKPNTNEVDLSELTRTKLFNLFERIKESKIVYILNPESFDTILLRYIELISVLQNTVVLHSEMSLNSEFSIVNEVGANINNMAIIKEDFKYKDRILIPIQRKVFLNNTFLNSNWLHEEQYSEGSGDIAISVVTSTNRKYNLPNYFNQMKKQKSVSLQIILVAHGFKITEDEIKEFAIESSKIQLEIVEVSKDLPLGYCLNAGISKANHPYIAKMDDDDFYFENYLIDSWIAAGYSGADLVGKYSTYTFFEENNLTISKYNNTRRKYHNFVMGATFFAKNSLMKKYMFSHLSTGEDSDFLRRINEDEAVVYADHPYNFCIFRSQDIESHTWQISDIDFMKNSTIESYDSPKNLLSI